jgi:hypothetical protein
MAPSAITSTVTKTISLRKRSLEVSIPDIKSTNNQQQQQQQSNKKPRYDLDFEEAFEDAYDILDNWAPVRTLASGQFGHMILVQDIRRGTRARPWFRSVLFKDKRQILDQGKIQNMKLEAEMFKKLDHPFILNVTETLQTERFLISITGKIGITN